MKMGFETRVTPESLKKYVVDLGWDDCLISSDEGFVYETLSGSARMVVRADGTGEYQGQRSLLFSHSVFARLTRAWIDDDLQVIGYDSRDRDIPPFVYFGDCYMQSLREQALKKELAPLKKHGEVYTEWVLRVLKARSELRGEIGYHDEVAQKIHHDVTERLKKAYRDLVKE